MSHQCDTFVNVQVYSSSSCAFLIAVLDVGVADPVEYPTTISLSIRRIARSWPSAASIRQCSRAEKGLFCDSSTKLTAQIIKLLALLKALTSQFR